MSSTHTHTREENEWEVVTVVVGKTKPRRNAQKVIFYSSKDKLMNFLFRKSQCACTATREALIDSLARINYRLPGLPDGLSCVHYDS
jgi:hypothetical protein